jgi:hypothetical protein
MQMGHQMPGTATLPKREGGRLRRWAAALGLFVVLAGPAGAVAGCGGGATAPVAGDARELTVPQRYGGAHAGGTATGDTDAGAAFARWVLEQDPQRRYITDAVVRGDQTLGVKVQPTVTQGELRDLLAALAEGMARTFPGRPLRVIAFYQSADKLAEATYDPRTRQVRVQ